MRGAAPTAVPRAAPSAGPTPASRQASCSQMERLPVATSPRPRCRGGKVTVARMPLSAPSLCGRREGTAERKFSAEGTAVASTGVASTAVASSRGGQTDLVVSSSSGQLQHSLQLPVQLSVMVSAAVPNPAHTASSADMAITSRQAQQLTLDTPPAQLLEGRALSGTLS